MAALLSLLLACAPTPSGGAAAGGADTAAEACPESLSWETAAAPLLLGQCAACHGSALQGELRWGAPEGVDLDHIQGALQHGEAALERMRDGTMPPGGGVSADQLERFERWLGCGGPGQDVAWPAAEPIAQVITALELQAAVFDAPEDPTLVAIEEWNFETGVVWSRELWRVDEDGAALAGLERYDEDGVPISVDAFEPALQVLPAESGLSREVRHTRQDADGGVEAWDERWTATVGPAGEIDGVLELDPDALSVAWRADGGAELELYLSETWGITHRHRLEVGHDPAGDRVRWLHLTDQPPEAWGISGLVPGRSWTTRVLGEVLP